MSPTPKRQFTVQAPEDQSPQMPGIQDIYQETKPAFLPPRRGGGPILKDGQLTIGAFTLTGTGLQINDNVSQEDWQKVGELLFKLEGSIQWLIGDWIAYGEDVQWGDIPAIAQALGREPGSLHVYTYVARSVQFYIRIQNLSFGHHQLVAPLSEAEQMAYLNYASENSLSVAAFRKWINEQQGKSSPSALPTPVPTVKDREWLSIRSDVERLSSNPAIIQSLSDDERKGMIGRFKKLLKLLGD